MSTGCPRNAELSTSTLTMLSHYWWPGNIRELENLIERLVAVVDHEFITDEDLPFEFHVVELDRCASDMLEALRSSVRYLVGLGLSRARA